MATIPSQRNSRRTSICEATFARAVVRSDKRLAQDGVSRSDAWRTDPFSDEVRPEIDQRYAAGSEEQGQETRWHSFSGHERNRLFVNHAGVGYEDISGLSGLDNIADGRAWAKWDFDRDGWTDVALCNANYPLLNLYRNLQGEQIARDKPHHFVALRLVGGNAQSSAVAGLSSRDAVGARVELRAGDLHITSHRQCGEGFAAQNSATLLLGLGRHQQIDEVTIHWPSGKTTTTESAHIDQWLWAFETPDVSPSGELFVTRAYLNPVKLSSGGDRVSDADADTPFDRLPVTSLLNNNVSASDAPRLYLFTTTAIWCEACHRLQPQLRRVAERFGNQIALYGVPIDPIETPDELRAFRGSTAAGVRNTRDNRR